MNKRCDLHSHSNFSDGTLTPTELVRLAKQSDISALALTDHNTSHGLREFMDAGRRYDLITVPGCEFTTEWNKKEIHIVGLFFNEKYWKDIEDYLELINVAKHNSNTSLIEKLNNAGYEIRYEEANALTDAGEFNRSHVARVLMAKGYVESVDEAFKTILKDGNGFYTPAQRLSALATVRFIKKFGATAIMAHPLLNLTYKELLDFLPQAKEEGLDAIETHYTEFDEEMMQTAISLANTFELKQSGGSDFHGEGKPGIYLGTGRGNLFVPYEFYENMKSCAPDYEE